MYTLIIAMLNIYISEKELKIICRNGAWLILGPKRFSYSSFFPFRSVPSNKYSMICWLVDL